MQLYLHLLCQSVNCNCVIYVMGSRGLQHRNHFRTALSVLPGNSWSMGQFIKSFNLHKGCLLIKFPMSFGLCRCKTDPSFGSIRCQCIFCLLARGQTSSPQHHGEIFNPSFFTDKPAGGNWGGGALYVRKRLPRSMGVWWTLDLATAGLASTTWPQYPSP